MITTMDAKNLSNERLKVYESIIPSGNVEISGKIDLETFNRSLERFFVAIFMLTEAEKTQ